MLSAKITIEKIDQQLFSSLVHLKLTLKNDFLGSKVDFKLSSTGTAIVVESQHIIFELQQLVKWLDTPSSNEDNLRTNNGELRAIAKEAIKAQKNITEVKTL